MHLLKYRDRRALCFDDGILVRTDLEGCYGIMWSPRLSITLLTRSLNRMRLLHTTLFRSDNICLTSSQVCIWGAVDRFHGLIGLLTCPSATSFAGDTCEMKYSASYSRIFLTSRKTLVQLLRVLPKKHLKMCSITLKVDFCSDSFKLETILKSFWTSKTLCIKSLRCIY